MTPLLLIGSSILSVLSWLNMWLLGSASTSRRLAGWAVTGAALLPAQVAYNTATGQWGFVPNNIVTAVLTWRGWRQARRDLIRPALEAWEARKQAIRARRHAVAAVAS